MPVNAASLLIELALAEHAPFGMSARALASLYVDNDDAGLLPGQNIAIGVGDGIERVFPVDDAAELASFHPLLEEIDELLRAAAPRQRHADLAVPRDRRPEQERYFLSPWPEIRDGEKTVGLHQPAPLEDRHFPDRIKHEVEGLAQLSEFGRRVIDHAISAERRGHVQMPRGDHRRDVCATIFRQLYRRCTDRAGCAVNQRLATGADAEFADARPGIISAFADRSLIEGGGRRHGRDRPRFGHA